MFFWQPPHVWAIALFRKDEYANAGFPVLPNVIGDEARRADGCCYYTLALVPVTLAPVALGLSRERCIWPWSLMAVNAWFVWTLRSRDPHSARPRPLARMFFASLGYLFALFGAMIAELVFGLVARARLSADRAQRRGFAAARLTALPARQRDP